MKSLTFSLAILAAFAFSSCSSIKYTNDKDGAVDFAKYNTFKYYGWAEESNKILNSIDQERLESAFGRELNKRGLEYEKETGDLIVTLYIVTEEKTSRSATTTSMGGYGGYGYGGYGGYYGHGPAYGWAGAGMGGTSHTTYSEYDYVVGTIVIDIYDAKDKKLIWESIAKGTIKEKKKGREDRINSTVGKMMLSYPVKPAK